MTVPMDTDRPMRRVFLALPRYGLALAVLAGVTAMIAGIGSRWGWWHFGVGFVILKWGVYFGLVGALVSLIGLGMGVARRSRLDMALGIAGFLIALVVMSGPLMGVAAAKRVPFIHDITTDTENPPRLVAVLPLRQNAPNSAEYGGPEIAAQQRAGYPDLGPANLPTPPDRAFEQALATARRMGWQIVDANASEGRIEATDTTFWFGFKDDIVIRVAAAGAGSRIDVRSVSRAGRSDVGTNAKRIRCYLKQLTKG